MNFKQLIADDDAVSPVIGVVLMVAITVILAAVIGTFVLGQADQLNENAPSVSFDYDGTSGETLTIVHKGGDSFDGANVQVKYDGQTTTGLSEDFGSGTISAGDKYTSSEKLAADQTVRVVWSSAEGGSSSQIGDYIVA